MLHQKKEVVWREAWEKEATTEGYVNVWTSKVQKRD